MTEEFNESMISNIREGDKVTGGVQQVEDKQAVVYINGGKFNGIIPISQLPTHHIENPGETVKVGDEVGAYVTKIEFNGENDTGAYILSKRQLETGKSYEYLQGKLDNDEMIEAEVTEVVKGGLVVGVDQGRLVPTSLISIDFTEDFSVFDGQAIHIKVEELDPENNRVILGRKAMEQLENNAKEASILDSLNEGDVIDGRIARSINFGTFIGIGGVDDLAHVSGLSHEYVQTPEEVVSVSEAIKVKIKLVRKDSGRISLSIKNTLPAPFGNIKRRFHEDDVTGGTVARLANFGVFVEIAPSVRGLMHISEIGRGHIGSPNKVLEPGRQVNVRILGVNEGNERISLSTKATLSKENAIEGDASTTQSYLEDDNDEDKPTLGDIFDDEFKDPKF